MEEKTMKQRIEELEKKVAALEEQVQTQPFDFSGIGK